MQKTTLVWRKDGFDCWERIVVMRIEDERKVGYRAEEILMPHHEHR